MLQSLKNIENDKAVELVLQQSEWESGRRYLKHMLRRLDGRVNRYWVSGRAELSAMPRVTGRMKGRKPAMKAEFINGVSDMQVETQCFYLELNQGIRLPSGSN